MFTTRTLESDTDDRESDVDDRESDIDDLESDTVGPGGNRDDFEPSIVALETERQSRHHGQCQHRVESIRDYYARERH